MGAFSWPLRISDIDSRRTVSFEALVDTGAAYTILPGRQLRDLGVEPTGQRSFLPTRRPLLSRLRPDSSLIANFLWKPVTVTTSSGIFPFSILLAFWYLSCCRTRYSRTLCRFTVTSRSSVTINLRSCALLTRQHIRAILSFMTGD